MTETDVMILSHQVHDPAETVVGSVDQEPTPETPEQMHEQAVQRYLGEQAVDQEIEPSHRGRLITFLTYSFGKEKRLQLEELSDGQVTHLAHSVVDAARLLPRGPKITAEGAASLQAQVVAHINGRGLTEIANDCGINKDSLSQKVRRLAGNVGDNMSAEEMAAMIATGEVPASYAARYQDAPPVKSGPRPKRGGAKGQEQLLQQISCAGDWQEGASCRLEPPGTFFPTDAIGIAVAKRICGGCAVIEPCLEYALANREEHGVWGGTSEKERRRMLKKRDRGLA